MRTTAQWKTLIASYIFKRPVPFPFDFKTRAGGIIRIEDWDELTTIWHVFFCDEYSVAKDAQTILDLGANIGAFAVWASQHYPAAKIFSVEPFPSTFERLSETIQKNDLGSNVSLNCLAVGGSDGHAQFDATEGKRSYCRSLISENSDAPGVDVECLTLASFLDRHELTTVDCLKMDVEGGEYDIFAAASIETLRRCKSITMEYHDESKADAIWTKLKEAGFEQKRLVSAGWSGLADWQRIG